MFWHFYSEDTVDFFLFPPHIHIKWLFFYSWFWSVQNRWLEIFSNYLRTFNEGYFSLTNTITQPCRISSSVRIIEISIRQGTGRLFTRIYMVRKTNLSGHILASIVSSNILILVIGWINPCLYFCERNVVQKRFKLQAAIVFKSMRVTTQYHNQDSKLSHFTLINKKLK